MATYKHRHFSPQEERELKRLAYNGEQTSSLVEYIAIMADIELPTEEEPEEETYDEV